jgi:peptide/nickel transport system ATP-binding protein
VNMPAKEQGRSGSGGEAPLIELDDVKTWFATPRGVLHAVDGVTLTVEKGETVGVVGESGSGKSVLARTVMQLTPRHAATSGGIRFRGRELRDMARDEARALWGRDISMVFQDPLTALNPVRRIGHQITEPLELHLRLGRTEARERAVELLAGVGIAEPRRRLRSYPHELSGGMRQRVCIAIAVACSPQVLFADEPTTALDVTIQRQILDLLADLQREEHMAMVLITHDLGVVARRADRVLVMYGGRIVESGPTASLFLGARHPYTAALLASIPRRSQPSHRRLVAIPGRPVDVVDPAPGCRFAPRCVYAQHRCLTEDPELTDGADPGHRFACFHPVGSDEGREALRVNRTAGRTAAGLEMPDDAEAVA